MGWSGVGPREGPRGVWGTQKSSITQPAQGAGVGAGLDPKNEPVWAWGFLLHPVGLQVWGPFPGGSLRAVGSRAPGVLRAHADRLCSTWGPPTSQGTHS